MQDLRSIAREIDEKRDISAAKVSGARGVHCAFQKRAGDGVTWPRDWRRVATYGVSYFFARRVFTCDCSVGKMLSSAWLVKYDSNCGTTSAWMAAPLL